MVYLDRNRNGVQNSGEPGLGGVTVALVGTDVAGNPVARISSTAEDGTYIFAGLLAGTYSVVELQPGGYFDGADAAGFVNGTVIGTASNDVITGIVLPWNGVGTGYRFAEEPPNARELGTTFIAGTVFHDQDVDGVLDSGEKGIAGSTIELRTVAGDLIQSTTTDPTGRYLFLDVTPGSYLVVQPSQPSGYGSTSPDTLPVTIPSSLTPAPNVNFGEANGSLSGLVFLDVNGNGVPDPGEPGLNGFVMTIEGFDTAGDPFTRTTTTTLDGTYTFTDLPPSDGTGYTLSEQPPDGFLIGEDKVGTLGGTILSSTVIEGVVIPPGGVGTGYNFASLVPATTGGVIAGVVFLDRNRDGGLTGGEGGLANVTIELVDGTGTVIDTAMTGVAGVYLFTDVALQPQWLWGTISSPTSYSRPSLSVGPSTSARSSRRRSLARCTKTSTGTASGTPANLVFQESESR